MTIPLPDEDARPNQSGSGHNPYIIAAVLGLSAVTLLFYKLSNAHVSSAYGNGGNVTALMNTGQIVVDVDGQVKRPGVYRLRIGSRSFDAVTSAGGLTDNANRRAVNLAHKLKDGEKLIIPAVGEAVPSTTPEPTTEGEAPGTESASVSNAPSLADDPGDVDDPPVDVPAPSHQPGQAASVNIRIPLQTAEPLPATPPPPPVSAASTPVVVAPSQQVSLNRASADELESLPGVGPKTAQAIVDYRKGPPPHAFTSTDELTNVPGIKDDKLQKILPYVKL